MACVAMGAAIVCGSWNNPNRYVIQSCPTCGCRRRMLRHWAGAYYGYDDTCLTCGDMWTEGEMYPRPFRRGWRSERVARAKAQPVLSAADFRRAVTADIDAAMGTDGAE